MTDLLDVIEVQISAPHRVRIVGSAKTERDANAVIYMAVARRGVTDHFFTTVPTGKFRDGEFYHGAE